MLLLVRPIRENALEAMVQVASESLPGTLTVRESSWPALSRIELGGIVWEDQEARLVSAERVAVDIDLGALRHKDVHARTIILEALEADLPALLAAFPAEETADGNPPDFPRAGSMPWAPSISLDSLVVDARSLVLDDSTTLSLTVALGLELRSGRPPRLEVERLAAGWIERGWELHSGGMQVSMASGEFKGGFDATLGELGSVRLDLDSDDDREFGLRLVDAAHPDPPLLEASGSFTQRDDGLVTSVDYVASLTSPELTRIEELTRRPGSLARLEPLGAVGLEARGHADLSGPVRGEVRLSASARPANVAALLRHEGSSVTVDSLRVTGEGLALDGEGTWRMEPGPPSSARPSIASNSWKASPRSTACPPTCGRDSP